MRGHNAKLHDQTSYTDIPMMTLKQIGQYLEDQMVLNNVTLIDISDATDWSQSYLRKVLNGEVPSISILDMNKICVVIGCDWGNFSIEP